MIVGRVGQLREKLQRKVELERADSERQNIQATLDALQRLKANIIRVLETYQRIRDRLPAELVAGVQSAAREISRDLEVSRGAFETTRRQVGALDRVSHKLTKLEADLGRTWEAYVDAQLEPYLELWRLVGGLPEMMAHETLVEALISQLLSFKAALPTTEGRLDDFDLALQRLAERLSVLHDLTPEVKRFLQKVIEKSATIADLSPEVLAWCQMGNHAEAFSISFRRQKGSPR